MAKDNAKVFVEKLFEDDEFIKTFYKNGGIKRKGSTKEKNELLYNTARKMGYDFEEKEFQTATSDYFKNKGILGFIKIFMHFNKVVKAAEREEKKH